MYQYLDVLNSILKRGVDKPNRTGVPSRALFAVQIRFDMADGFPAVTTKQLAFKKVKAELLWFLSGSRDIKDLQNLGGTGLWEKDAYNPEWLQKAEFPGDVGRIYGVQWRKWKKYGVDKNGRAAVEEIDQIANLIEKLKNNPNDRRMIVTAWNPVELDQMCLPPCHRDFQCFVADGKISLHMNQRSCDMILGVPFNIASYALFLSMLAQVSCLVPKELVITLGDAHIYHNHLEIAEKQLDRKPYPLPKLWLNTALRDIDHFKMDDIKLKGYIHHGKLDAELNTGETKWSPS